MSNKRFDYQRIEFTSKAQRGVLKLFNRVWAKGALRRRPRFLGLMSMGWCAISFDKKWQFSRYKSHLDLSTTLAVKGGKLKIEKGKVTEIMPVRLTDTITIAQRQAQRVAG